MPESGYFIKNKHLFLRVLETMNSEFKVLASCEGCLAMFSQGRGHKGKKVWIIAMVTLYVGVVLS